MQNYILSPMLSKLSFSKNLGFLALLSTFLFFALSPEITHAAWDGDGDLAQIVETSPEASVDGELAHLWFELMFGEFIWAPWGEGCTSERCTTVLSKAIGFTNVLAMLMGLAVAYYLMLGGAINTAHTGEVLGKSWSSVWLPIRTAIGFSLITPAAIGGSVMSTIQLFVLWLIILGSNAASVLWSALADDFASGTPVIRSNQSLGMSPTVTIFQSLMCARAELEAEYTRSDGAQKIAKIVRSNSGSTTVTSTAGSNLRTVSTFINRDTTESVIFGNEAECGKINFPPKTSERGSDAENDAYNAGIDAARGVIADTTRALEGLVNNIWRDRDINGSGLAIMVGIEDKDSTVLSSMDGWAADFYTIARSFDQEIRTEIMRAAGDDDLVREWKNQITKGGWAQAGVWYFEVSKFQGMIEDLINASARSVSPPADLSCNGISSWFDSCLDENVTIMADQIPRVIASTSIRLALETSRNAGRSTDKIFSDESIFVGTSKQQDSLSPPEPSELGTTLSKMLLNSLSGIGSFSGQGLYGEKCVENERSGFENESNRCEYGASSPFYTVSQIGHGLKNIGIIGWAAAGTAYVLSNATKEAGGPAAKLVDWFAARETLSAILMWLVFTIVPFVGAAIAQGFMLGFVVPFLPLLTWTFMICGYLLSVVEAVVAAPLAIIMMVTPEGEGISGTRLERAMSLIAMVTLKPSLMIIGLIASMTLGNILFSILNQFFWSGSMQLMGFSPLEIIFMMTLYVTAAYKLCLYTVSIMHKLPDQILEWFTSGAARSFGEQEISGAAQQVGSAGGQAFGQMGGASMKALQFQRDQMRNKMIKGDYDQKLESKGMGASGPILPQHRKM